MFKNKQIRIVCFPVLILLVLLTIFSAVVISEVRDRWPIGDETETVTTGYANALYDFRVGRNNPPLVKLLMTFPLRFMDLDFPIDEEAWRIGHNATGRLGIAFMFYNRMSPQEILFPCRMVILCLSWVLSFCIFFWAKRLWGTASGIWSVLLFLLCPAVIAYSGIAMTEIGITLFFFLGVAALWWFMQKPVFKRLAVLGLATGGALAAKVTGVLLFPIQLAVFFYIERRISLKTIRWFLWIGIFACLSIAFFYRFSESWKYTETLRQVFAMVLGSRAWGIGFMNVMNPPTFLHIPILFLIKLPIPLLFLFPVGLWFVWKSEKNVYVVFPAVIFTVIAILSQQHQGERFFVPMYPYWCMCAGRLLHDGFSKGKMYGVLMAALLGWLIYANMKVYPNHLMYFNEISGGPQSAWQWCDYSDLGQDGYRLVKFQEKYPGASLMTAVRSSHIITKKASFPVQIYTPWEISNNVNPVNINREFFAVSVDFMHGADRNAVHFYGWFKNLKPYAVIGHSIYIYDITHDPRPHFLMASRYMERIKESSHFAVLAERERQRALLIKKLKKYENSY